MRSKLFTALLLASIPAILLALANNSQINNTNAEEELQSVVHSNLSEGEKKKTEGHEQIVNSSKVSADFDWLFQAAAKVVFFVLFGWAAGRVFMQFRRVIVIFLSLLIIFNFALDQTELVDFQVHYDNFDIAFEKIKGFIMRIGFVDFFAILLGLWAGVNGFMLSKTQEQVVNVK